MVSIRVGFDGHFKVFSSNLIKLFFFRDILDSGPHGLRFCQHAPKVPLFLHTYSVLEQAACMCHSMYSRKLIFYPYIDPNRMDIKIEKKNSIWSRPNGATLVAGVFLLLVSSFCHNVILSL